MCVATGAQNFAAWSAAPASGLIPIWWPGLTPLAVILCSPIRSAQRSHT
jgi:hypothetical protein